MPAAYARPLGIPANPTGEHRGKQNVLFSISKHHEGQQTLYRENIEKVKIYNGITKDNTTDEGEIIKKGRTRRKKNQKRNKKRKRKKGQSPFQPVAALAYNCSMKVFAALVVWFAV